ncbi:AI-2E family transporter [Serpentinicella alkaliphila]|nr:AI-2E family transporter [Serpentinicella alkaliphila]
MTQIVLLLLICALLYYLIQIGNRYIDRDRRVNIGRKQVFYTVAIILSLIAIVFLFNIRNVIYETISPFIFAIILAYVLNPVVQYLNDKGIGRLWAVLLVYLAIILVFIILSITIVPKVSEEVKRLIDVMPRYSNGAYDYINNIYSKFNRNVNNLPQELDDVKEILRMNINRLQGIVFGFFATVTDSVIRFLSKIIGVILIPILSFYFLKDKDKFKKSLILLIPKSIRKQTISIAKDIDCILVSFIRGQLTVALFVGILTTIALLILRVEFAIIVGLIAGIANIIPYFGPVIGIVPGVIFALMDGPMKAIWVIITFTIIQQIESGIISPKIVGESVGIHPVFIILALIIGGKYLGVFGLLIAVPVAAIIKVVFKHFVRLIASH